MTKRTTMEASIGPPFDDNSKEDGTLASDVGRGHQPRQRQPDRTATSQHIFNVRVTHRES